MALATARALENLGPLVLGDHALKLKQQLVFRRRTLRRFDEYRFYTVASKLFHEQDLVGVFATKPVGSVHKHGVKLSRGVQETRVSEPVCTQVDADPADNTALSRCRWAGVPLLTIEETD